MIANGRGFLHDLDYAFNWKAFLYSKECQETIASWEEYVRTGVQGISKGNVENKDPPASGASKPDAVPAKGTSRKARFAPPLPVVNRAGHNEWYMDRILAERVTNGKARRKEYLVLWEGYPDPTWEPATHMRDCEPFLGWKARTAEERADLSKAYTASQAARPAMDGASGASKISDESGLLRDSRSRSECKERTVSRGGLICCRLAYYTSIREHFTSWL